MTEASRVTFVLAAAALAVQPWSVLAAVLLVTSPRGVVKTVAFVLGWAAALTAVALVALALAPDRPTPTTSTVQYAIEVAVGVLLLGWLALRWRRPAAGPVQPPRWLSRVDTMPARLALLLGAFLPNYVLVVAAVNELVLAKVYGAALVAGIAVFVAIASAGVAAPLLVLAADRRRAPQRLAGWRAWLVAHNRAVLFAIGTAVGALLLAKGIVGLLR